MARSCGASREPSAKIREDRRKEKRKGRKPDLTRGQYYSGKFNALLGLPTKFPGDLLHVLTHRNGLGFVLEPTYAKSNRFTDWLSAADIMQRFLRRALPYKKIFEAMRNREWMQSNGDRQFHCVRGPRLTEAALINHREPLIASGLLIKFKQPSGTPTDTLYGLGPQFFANLISVQKTLVEDWKVGQAAGANIEYGFIHLINELEPIALFAQEANLVQKLQKIQEVAQQEVPLNEAYQAVQDIKADEDEEQAHGERYTRRKSEGRKIAKEMVGLS